MDAGEKTAVAASTGSPWEHAVKGWPSDPRLLNPQDAPHLVVRTIMPIGHHVKPSYPAPSFRSFSLMTNRTFFYCSWTTPSDDRSGQIGLWHPGPDAPVTEIALYFSGVTASSGLLRRNRRPTPPSYFAACPSA